MALTNQSFTILFLLLGWMCNIDQSPVIVETASRVSSQCVLKKELHLNREEGIFYLNEKPFIGIAEVYYDNDQIAQTIEFIDGKKSGPVYKWFKNGMLSYSATLVNGRLHGISKSWWKNGQIRSVSFFANGLTEGIQRQWYKSGSIFKEQQLLNGKEEGIQRAWRENGKIYNNYEAKEGRIFGLKRANLCFQLDNENIELND